MYRNNLSWELTSLEYHIRAIIETIRNDALRKLWTELLNTELDFYDKYLKYGKMKGWLRAVPMYGERATQLNINKEILSDYVICKDYEDSRFFHQ